MKRVIEFLKYRYIAIGLSFLMFAAFTAGTIAKGGLNFGIDFAGGVKVIAKFDKGINEPSIRKVLSGLNPVVQQIGSPDENEYIVSTKLSSEGDSSKQSLEAVKKILAGNFKNVKFMSEENVGPAIGDFLKKSAIKLFAIAIILMLVYLSFRFEFKYSIGALVALIHDIGLTIVFCGLAGVEINIPVVAAVLTIFGYSINDTIVIFDRIRENIQIKTKQTFFDVINKSITQSLSRTLLTSLTTLFSVLALYFLGGDVLNDFALVLLFGVVVGTYSSVYVASPVLLGWEKIASRK